MNISKKHVNQAFGTASGSDLDSIFNAINNSRGFVVDLDTKSGVKKRP